MHLVKLLLQLNLHLIRAIPVWFLLQLFRQLVFLVLHTVADTSYVNAINDKNR